MKKLSTLITLFVLASCKVDNEHHGAGPVQMETGADPSAATEMATVADGTDSQADGSDTAETTDPSQCTGDDWGHYTCQGWIAGLYRYQNKGTNYQFAFNSVEHAECVTIPLCEPVSGGMDSEFLAMRCKAKCDQMVLDGELPAGGPWPATSGVPTAWDFAKTVCIFAPNGNNGTVPNPTDGVTNQPTGTPEFKESCDNIAPLTDPMIPQEVFEGCFDNDMCANEMGACPGWDPGARITSSLNSSTKTYTVTIKKSLIAELMDGDYACLWAANEGMWTYTDSPSPLRWKFKGLSATHFYYKMGFRNDDWDATIKSNAIGATVYALSTFNGMNDAFDALNPPPASPSYVITFKRGASTYTMNLTFIN